jgi:hypothetical protein
MQIIKACISPEVTVKGFKKCCTSNTVDENDDDMLWNGSKEDGDVKSEYEEDEATDCEDGDIDANW